jgi:hypothetical protein
MTPLLSWLQTSRVAAAMGESTLLTAFLSGVHLLGLTLVVGGAIVSSLRFIGWMFPERPAAEVTSGAVRGITVGLVVSVATGILLLAPRASAAAENEFFRAKMLLLVTAAAFHFAVYRRLTSRRAGSRASLALAGALSVALWLGVAIAGCAYILLE